MKIKDILPYLDLEKLKADTARDVINALTRASTPGYSHLNLEVQYGDEPHQLAVDQAKLNLKKTKAEIAQVIAAAASDIASAGAILSAKHRIPPTS